MLSQSFKKILYLLLIYFIFPQYGKNIVQYDEFDWHFIQTEHFDIYYSSIGEKNIDLVASFSEEAYDKISNLIGWDLKHRSSIIFYNSHNEFQQTNVIESYMREGIGGVTELMKNRMVVPYDGSMIDFEQVIYHELVHVFINDGIYGGSLQSLINSNTVFIPLWMNEGLAEYLSNTWDTNSDMWIRDLAINAKTLPEIKDLNGYFAYRGGQSLWKFICEKWGEEVIAEIFYSIKVKKDINKGVKAATGVDLKELTKQWHKYLKKEYWPDVATRDDVQDIARQLTDHNELNNSYNIAPSPSPDGTKIAIYSNRDGEMGIYILSAIDGKFIKRIVRGNRTGKFEELHFLKPGISWSPDGENIIFSGKSDGYDALFIYDVNSKKEKFSIIKVGLNGIFKPAWNPKNDKIAFIGNNGFSSDVYIYDLDDQSLINLTNDHFSDIQVTWHPNGESLLLVSDRGNNLFNTELVNLNLLVDHDFNNLDIYTINLDGEIERITNTPYNEEYAVYSPDGTEIAYLSDESGISNIYIINVLLLSLNNEEQNSKPVTNVLTGISQINWLSNNKLIFTGFYDSAYDIFILSNINRDIKKIKEIPLAKWKSKGKLKLLRKSKEIKSENNNLSNFIFSPDNLSDNNNTISFNPPILKDNQGKYKKYKYLTRFTLDYARAVYTFDSYYGSAGMGVFLFSDILGDHRVAVGIELQSEIEESDYFVQYRYLKKKVNHEGQLYNRAQKTYVFTENMLPPSYFLYRNVGVDYRLSYPFSRFSRLEGGINYNYYMKKYYTWQSNEYNESGDFLDKKIVLPYAKFVFDNTRWFYLHPVSGSRIYIKYDVAPGGGVNDFNYNMLTFDSRSYFELSYTGKISIAARIYGGSSWGPDKRKYAIGGVPWVASSDSDLINTEYEDALGNDDYYYMNNFVLPIRGYELGSRYGNKTVLMNFELRLPMLVYYFPTIEYLGQIFGVFFVDMGVAWNDKYPKYSERDSWNNDNGTGWIMSYGLGPRFIFFGMPWKLDYAWQYDPYKGKKSERSWYLSIGLDF